MSSADVPALRPGQVIGILGGGQLGRMLGMAAARLGLRTHVYDPQEACPAADVCGEHTVAAFEDQAAMARFAAAVDAITFEWESVPIQALAALERTPPVRPRVAALTVLACHFELMVHPAGVVAALVDALLAALPGGERDQ